MSQENVQLVRNLYDAFSRRDVMAIVSALSPDIEIVQSTELPWGGSFKGLGGFQQFFQGLLANVTSQVTVERYLDAGEQVVAIGKTTGTVNATGASFDVPVAHVWTVREGKAVKFSPFIDNPTMLAVLKK